MIKQITKRLLCLSLVSLSALAFTLAAYAAEPCDYYVFDPDTFTHDDDIDRYDTFTPSYNHNANAKDLQLHMANYSNNPRRYGAYLRGSADEHLYCGLRVNFDRKLPTNVLSIYAEPGIEFLVTDNYGEPLADHAGVIEENGASNFHKTTVNGQDFYYMELLEYDGDELLDAGDDVYFYITLTNSTNDDLHYNLWYGHPLLGISYDVMRVTQSVTYPSTTSSSASTTVNNQVVPSRSWLKSASYLAVSEQGTSYISNVRHEITMPDGFGPWPVSESGYDDGLPIRPARGTYSHNIKVSWITAPGNNAKYTNVTDFFVEYFHIFGANEQPYISSRDNLKVDYARDVVFGFEPGYSYQYSYNGDSIWANLPLNDDGEWDIFAVMSAKPTKIFVRRNNSFAVSFISLPSRRAAPTTPTFVYNDPNYPGQALLTGMTEAMEYRTGSTGAWTPYTGNPVVCNIPGTNQSYYVRTVSSGNFTASAYKLVTLSKIGNAPSVSFDATNETIGTIKEGMGISLDDVNYTLITIPPAAHSISDLLDSINGSSITLYVKQFATATVPESVPKQFTLHQRLAKPTNISFNNQTNVVTGLTTAMQYRVKGTSAWTNLTGTSLNVSAHISADDDVILEFRYKPTASASASQSVEIFLPVLAQGPALSLDYVNETIVGFESGASYQYNTNGSTTSWGNIALTNNTWDVSGLIANSAKVFHIRKAASGTVPATAATQVPIPARSGAPSAPIFVYNQTGNYDRAALTETSSAMEYRLSTQTAWISCTGSDIAIDIPTANATYYVRTKGVTGTSVASQNKTLTLLKRGTAPGTSINTTNETIGALSTAMEMQINNSAFTAIETATSAYDVSGLINSLTSGTTTINIRTAATSTAPASALRVITLYPRLSAPSGISYNANNFVVSGLANTMQYRVLGATNWTNLTAATLNVASLLSADDDVILEIRYKPTATASASQSVNTTLPALPSAPSLTVDFEQEVITGFISGSSYQYNTTGSATSWTNITLVNGKWDLYSIIATSAKTLYIRQAATSSTPATAPAVVSIPKRNAAPTSPKLVYNNPSHAGKAVMTDVDSGMEYRKSTDTQWVTCSGDIVFNIPTANETYYVRTKGIGSTTPASSNKSLTLAKRGAAPNVSLNATNETIGSLTVAMEMSNDGTSYAQVAQATTAHPVSAIIDSITGANVSLYIRTAATATAPASLEKTITLYPRASQPVGASYDSSTKRINGVNNTVQYRAAGTTAWSTVSGTFINCTTYINNSVTQVEIRRAPVNNSASASAPVTISIY